MYKTTPDSRRRLAGMALAGLLLASTLPWLAACSDDAIAQGGPPGPPPVSVAPVTQRTVSDVETFSGRLEAAAFVELRPRISGIVERVHFKDGALVRKGDLLFSVDARPFAAEVARAQSQLAAAKARAQLATADLARAQQLLADRAVSKQEFDQLTASTRTSEADLQAAEAALQVARLSLGYASVRAPIAGRASRANVTAGNLVSPEVVLTSIAGVARVHAYFEASEASFLRLQAAGKAQPDVRMGLANEEGLPHTGALDFIDNRLDPLTGAIRLRASFDNREGRFMPGMAVRLSLATSAPYPALLVPDRAIGTDQTRKFVVVVGADGQPQFRPVQPGTAFGPMRAVTGDLKPGEHIVVDGLQRIIPGVPVTPQLLPVDEQGMPVFPPPAGRQG